MFLEQVETDPATNAVSALLMKASRCLKPSSSRRLVKVPRKPQYSRQDTRCCRAKSLPTRSNPRSLSLRNISWSVSRRHAERSRGGVFHTLRNSCAAPARIGPAYAQIERGCDSGDIRLKKTGGNWANLLILPRNDTRSCMECQRCKICNCCIEQASHPIIYIFCFRARYFTNVLAQLSR